MELKFTEMDDLNNQNYWEQKPEKPKKKKVNFDDILSNMNLVVNKQGILQYMSINPNEEQKNYENSNNQHNQPINPQHLNVNKSYNNETLDPNVKHSYIYNKYFKEYKDNASSVVQPELKVIRTDEEFRRMIIEDRIKAIKEKKRIEEIKSTKMLFTNVRNIQASKNNLRKMPFM
jgi:hypothetical protein